MTTAISTTWWPAPNRARRLPIDPLEWGLCLSAARARGWTITQILNTHEHADHTGGNAGLVGATGAKLLAHAQAASRIGGVDRGLTRGDVIRVGRTVELECLDTPGHTLAHICLFAHAPAPALFSGDTLSMPVPGTAAAPAGRTCSTIPSQPSWRRCRIRPACFPVTSTWSAISSSRSTGNRTTGRPANCLRTCAAPRLMPYR